MARKKIKRIIDYKDIFLYKISGLHIEPSQNFVDKFMEIYNTYNRKKIDEITAKYYVNLVIEAIIHCLDFGISILIRPFGVFKIATHDTKIIENHKKCSVLLCSDVKNNIRATLNKDNTEYQKYIQTKKQNHKEIMQYYNNMYYPKIKEE